MNMVEIARNLGLKSITPDIRFDKDMHITKGHSSDLMSDVLANAPEGGLLVTIQVHVNVIAVAIHAGLAGVIFSSGMTPEERVVHKAVEEGLALFVSEDSTFDIVGKLYALGIRGNKK
jgi:hypothetical protein